VSFGDTDDDQLGGLFELGGELFREERRFLRVAECQGYKDSEKEQLHKS